MQVLYHSDIATNSITPTGYHYACNCSLLRSVENNRKYFMSSGTI